MNKHRHIFKDIHVEFVTRKMVFEDAFDMMRLHLQGRPHTLKTSGVNVCVCVLAYVQYCDEPWRCHLLLHVAAFLCGVDRERGVMR